MSALKYWLWLSNLPGLGNQVRLALLERFGDPEQIYYADRDQLALTDGMTREGLDALEDHSLKPADRILADCDRLDLRVLTLHDADYPGRLKNIYDPPCLLYLKGRMTLFDEEAAVAVVGTRSCTPYGVAAAEKLGYGLTKGGGLVVSGLARGVDAAATRGALRAGGVTAAVVGNGLDIAYPAENHYLYEDVAAAGALLSEYPPGTRPVGRNFPMRNRILSGLCLAALVVEAPLKSGALITAEAALEQGRDVFAVPGPIDAPASQGCNRLIRDGAGLVSEAWDILREYEGRFPEKLRAETSRQEPQVLGHQAPPEVPAKPALPVLQLSQSPVTLSDDQIVLLRVLTEEPQLVDDLIEQSGLPTRRVLSALTVLEMDALIVQHPGKRYTRAVTLCE